ncbi:MAG: hypothetical protein ABI640_13210 [Gammaproteobacteria bacterium]
MTDPTTAKMFATAFPVAHHLRLDTTRPCYWQLTARDGRSVYVLAMSMADAGQWARELFPDCECEGVKLRTAIGTPPL